MIAARSPLIFQEGYRQRSAPCLRRPFTRTVISASSNSRECTATGSPETVPTPVTGSPTWDGQLPAGRLVIRPISSGDVQAAGVVLTRAFADSAEAVVLKDVLQDVESLLTTNGSLGASCPPLEYFLVARLYPTAPGTVALPPGQDSRLIGTAALSLSPEAPAIRRLPSVNLPPADAAYISNMAVDPRFRRQGVARALLSACEDVARRAGRREAWLHVREADAAARALYDGQGFVAVGKDSWLDTMKLGMRARVLMRKSL